MPTLYSHRNGETEPPTIHEEYYWFIGDEDSSLPNGCFYIYPHFSNDDPARLAGVGGAHIADMTGRWWGPVTPPGDEEDG